MSPSEIETVAWYGGYELLEYLGPPAFHQSGAFTYKLLARHSGAPKRVRGLTVRGDVEAALGNPRLRGKTGGELKTLIKVLSVACLQGLLDLGLFEESREYTWVFRKKGEVFEPRLAPNIPDFDGDLCQEVSYCLLKALHRRRQERPRLYRGWGLGPDGICLVLQIGKNYFRYVAGLLEERGQIKAYGNIYGGEFFITEGGIEALLAMYKSRRPGWLTTRPNKEVEVALPGIVQLTKDWRPKQRFRSEEAYEAALAEWLVGRGIKAPEQQGASLTDVLAAQGVAVEIKLNPSRSEYDRLMGQIMRQLEEFGAVIVLIARPERRDLLEEYQSRWESDDRVFWVTK
jgi:hypothetical protein